jgi:magnesium transporter
MPSGPERVVVTCIDYCPNQVCAVDILDIDDFLGQHRPAWSAVRWINVDGLTDMKIVQALVAKYDLHPLAVEDMLNPVTRPKVEIYPGDDGHQARLFLVARMISIEKDRLHCEQISFFIGKHTLLTFQPTRGDIWDPVRQRLCQTGSRLRQNDVSFLVYTLLDGIVDQCFPVLGHYSDRLEELEEEVLLRPSPPVIHRIHHLKHELLLLRREFWPMRELIHSLQRLDHDLLSDTAALFMRDVYDHSVQVIELMETYREVTISITETYMNAMSQRMNQTMKVLTVIATIFMPLSFLAGVYGMNFQTMPEMESAWTYPWIYPIGFWTACCLIVAVMFAVFKKKHWL